MDLYYSKSTGRLQSDMFILFTILIVIIIIIIYYQNEVGWFDLL